MILEIAALKQVFNLSDYPVSITAASGVATITLPNHPFKDGQTVNITGTTKFNGKKEVKRLTPNTVSFLTSETGTENGMIKQWDELLTEIIDHVESFITNYCGVKFGDTASASEIMNLNVDGILYPSRGRLKDGDVTQILLSAVNNFSDSSKFITLTADDFFLFEDSIELNLEKAAPYLNCRRAVKITYTTQNAPAGIKSAAMQMAQYHWDIYNNHGTAIVTEADNGNQKTYEGFYKPSILAGLDQFKRITIGRPF